MFTEQQLALYKGLPESAGLTDIEFDAIKSTQDETYLESLGEEKLLLFLKIANALYRAGEPAVEDAFYDFMLSIFARLNPQSSFLHTVEPEPIPTPLDR